MVQRQIRGFDDPKESASVDQGAQSRSEQQSLEDHVSISLGRLCLRQPVQELQTKARQITADSCFAYFPPSSTGHCSPSAYWSASHARFASSAAVSHAQLVRVGAAPLLDVYLAPEIQDGAPPLDLIPRRHDTMNETGYGIKLLQHLGMSGNGHIVKHTAPVKARMT
ncbi:hypothetical protein BKA93DRAFT_750711 [Sparassis latifolia]